MMPGMKPRMVRKMLMSRSLPHPRSRKTPRGGSMIAKMILQISLWVMKSALGKALYDVKGIGQPATALNKDVVL
jgi:hypothetical protein